MTLEQVIERLETRLVELEEILVLEQLSVFGRLTTEIKIDELRSILTLLRQIKK